MGIFYSSCSCIFRDARINVVDKKERISKRFTNSKIYYIEPKPEYHKWELPVFSLSNQNLFDFAILIFAEYDMLSKFNVDKKKLMHFIKNVCQNYRDNRFHNFKHGWSVFHMTFLLLRSGADRYLTEIDIFCLLIASLCHDVGHPGNDNGFELRTNSELYQKYNVKPVLEYHHASLTAKILNEPANDILSNLSRAQREQSMKSIRDAILCTDMDRHNCLMEILLEHNRRPASEERFHRDSAEETQHLMGLIIHTADLSGQALDECLALEWGRRCLDEFNDQARREREAQLEVTPYLRPLGTEIGKMRCQKFFVGQFVEPLWYNMYKCFPDLKSRYDQVTANKMYYEKRIEQLERLESSQGLEDSKTP